MINSVFIHQHLAPGDAVVLTGMVRDLKSTYPNLKINVDTTAQYIWDNNPYLDRSITKENAEKVYYGTGSGNNKLQMHFI